MKDERVQKGPLICPKFQPGSPKLVHLAHLLPGTCPFPSSSCDCSTWSETKPCSSGRHFCWYRGVMGPSGPGSAQRALSQPLRLSPLSPSALYTYFTGTGQGQEHNANLRCWWFVQAYTHVQSCGTDLPELGNRLPSDQQTIKPASIFYLSFPLCVCNMHVCAYMCKNVCDLVHVQALRLMSRTILNY